MPRGRRSTKKTKLEQEQEEEKEILDQPSPSLLDDSSPDSELHQLQQIEPEETPIVNQEKKIKEILKLQWNEKQTLRMQLQKELELETERDRQEFAQQYQKKQVELLKLQTQINRLKSTGNVDSEEFEKLQKTLEDHKQSIKQYEERNSQRKLHRIQSTYPWLTSQEIETALKTECGQNEDKCIEFFADEYNLKQIRLLCASQTIDSLPPRLEGPFMSSSGSIEVSRRGRVPKEVSVRWHKKKHDLKGSKKLRLDDALKQGNTDGWSEARIRAYQMRDQNPNAYYYRFNDPGEQQRNGKWTKEEEKMFFDRMKEVGVNGNWGIFSMTIPGRVGYQCSNYYRQLIESGRVQDPNYQIINGKAKFLFGGRKAEKHRVPRQSSSSQVKPAKKPPKSSANDSSEKKKQKKKKKKEEDEDDEDDEDFVVRSYGKKRKNESEEDVPEPENDVSPLNDYLDPITFLPLDNPYISPSGYVANYSTWINSLTEHHKQKNVCPFTRQPLSKRELIKITFDNFEKYQPLMKDLTKDE